MAEIIGSLYGGIDTHKDIHVAAVIDHLGRFVQTRSCPTSTAGYEGLWDWMESLGAIAAIGIEGTGSYGAGVTRYLRGRGVVIKEVNRPNRQLRRQRGKNDAVDAEAAARAVLAGHAAGDPKTQDGIAESIRLYRLMLLTFRKEHTALINTLRNVLLTGPDSLRQQLEAMPSATLFRHCSRLRVGNNVSDPAEATRATLRTLARQINELDTQLKEIRTQLTCLVTEANPELISAKGVGVDSASILLVAAGDNPERLRNEASFAALCGVSPIEASSGKNSRHRLNRGGNRQANNALWRIAMSRVQTDPRTKEYVARKRSEGRTPRHILRCLKRFIARELYRILTDPHPITSVEDLRPKRVALGMSMQVTANHCGVAQGTISRLERGINVNYDLARHYRTWLDQQSATITT